MLIPKQPPLSLRNIVPLALSDLRHHVDLRDMLEQFLPGRRWIASQQSAKVSHLPQDEIADVRQMGIDGIVSSGEKLVGEFPQLLLTLVDRLNEEGRRSRSRCGFGQPTQLPFEFLLALPHLSHLVREIGKRALHLLAELVQNVFNGVALQNIIL